MIQSESMLLRCVSTILHVRAVNRCFSWIILHAARTIRRRSQRSFPAWLRAAYSLAAALIGGETAEHAGIVCRKTNTILPVLQSASWIKKDLITGESIKGRRYADRHGFHRSTQQRIFSGPKGILRWTKRQLDTYHEELGKTLGEALLSSDPAFM